MSLIEGDEKQELSESVVCSGWAVIPSGKADAVPDLTLWSLLEGRWVWDSTDDLPPGPSRVDGQWWIGLRYDVLPQNTCGTQLPSLLLLESHRKKRVSSYFGSDPVNKKKEKKKHFRGGWDCAGVLEWCSANLVPRWARAGAWDLQFCSRTNSWLLQGKVCEFFLVVCFDGVFFILIYFFSDSAKCLHFCRKEGIFAGLFICLCATAL